MVRVLYSTYSTCRESKEAFRWIILNEEKLYEPNFKNITLLESNYHFIYGTPHFLSLSLSLALALTFELALNNYLLFTGSHKNGL